MADPGPPVVSRRFPTGKRLMLLTAVLVAAVAFSATGPPRTERLAAPRGADGRTLRGAFHIHSTRSDGALDRARIASAAARAGLRFAVFTDHGDGTRVPDSPAYVDGVLCLDGVEISTEGGHYLAIGMAPAPYPLGGEAAAVMEDVRRLGGFGVVAHPVSPRAELEWTAWEEQIGALEWLNADSEWRDESGPRLARALLDYWWRPAGALATLLDRPVGALARWDQLVSSRPVVGLAGHDAHGGFGAETGTTRGRRLHVPSYEASFRTFSLYATVDTPLTGRAVEDSAALIRALRGGHVFTTVDAIATPGAFAFSATSGGGVARMGDTLPPPTGAARFSVTASAPRGARIVLVREGRPVAESGGGELLHEASLPGAYRVEIHARSAPGRPPVPWLVSNPIYLREAPPTGPETSRLPVSIHPLMQFPWRVESAAGSSGTIAADGESLALGYRLATGERASQFVAFVVDLGRVPADANTIVLRGRADRPMRVSAQLRFANHGGMRWKKSFYLDEAGEREVRIPVQSLVPADGRRDIPDSVSSAPIASARPPTARATSLLFVVDLTNARPGEQGSFVLGSVALARQE